MDLKSLSLTIEKIKEELERIKFTERSNRDIENIISNIKRASYKRDENKLEEKINNIKSVFIRNWERDNVPLIRNLVNTINLDKGIPLPILSICGQGSQEVRFTKYLSYFLDPDKKHGLQDKLLQALFNSECELLGLDLNWSRNCKVLPEINLGEIPGNNKTIGCFADIGIEGEDYIIIVEQKISSSESKHPDSNLNQLERYNLALDSNPKYKDKKKIKIYLTPNKSNKEQFYGWLSITHEELIDRALKLLQSKNISKIGKENLVRLLIDLAVGPYDVLEEHLEEIIILGNKLIDEKFHLKRFVRFNKLIDDNKKVIEILMEGY